MRIPLLLCLSLILSPVFAADLDVRLSNAPASGTLVFQVYDSPNSFGDFRDPVVERRMESRGDAEYSINDVPDTDIAVLVYFDANDNGTLDKNFIGIPREPIGLSNGYRPKGPPSFQRAAFSTEAAGRQLVNIELSKVLGERGRLGVGAGVIGQSSPYLGSDTTVLQPIPAITYNGERLQWLGPNIQYGILGVGKARLALSASYRIGAYEEDDSPVLAGLGDRNSTLMAGMGFRYEIPGGVNLLLRYEHDVLDRIGGGQATARISKGLQAGIFRFVPQLAVNWLSDDITRHEFGVPAGAAVPGRPEYAPGSSTSYTAGFGSFVELSEDWRIVFNIGVDYLDSEISDSPIVEHDYIFRGFAAVTYVF
jgi:outer membrane protein